MDSREYAECDGVELAARIRAGAITATQALSCAYELIDRLDGQINAFVSLEEELAHATASAPGQGPLAGVPLAMKDCVGSVRGVTRSFGSRLAAGTHIDHDDEVVARYKAAGLIPMGTTNVPELSSSLSTESRLHGPCRSPWNLARSVGGSSGGAAAAVAYGAVPIAYGNDSAGSLRVPASCCGVFGFRPGRGRIPTGPVHGEIWFGLLSHHVITRTVRDSALVLDVSEGIDAGAPYGAPDKKRAYLEECATPATPIRIAVSDGAEQGFAIDAECAAGLEETATLLRNLGHQVAYASPRYSGTQLIESVTTLLAVALAEEIPEIAAATKRDIGPETVESCQRTLMERGRKVAALELSRTLRFKGELGRILGRFLEDYDVLLTPTLAELPIRLGTLNTDSNDLDAYLERMWRYSPFTPLANVCGIPSMSVPLCWSVDGLPIGMMFTGRYAEEGLLFRLAGQLESARPWRSEHPPISAWNLGGIRGD
ncbi:MAG: amidase [Steroidobacteraceae bacterium]